MKSNDVEYEYIKKREMTEKTGAIRGLDLPEKAEHSEREREMERAYVLYVTLYKVNLFVEKTIYQFP